MHMWSLSEKCLKINSCFENFFESIRIISCEPIDNLINFSLSTSFFLYFGNIERIDSRDRHGEYFGVLHGFFLEYFIWVFLVFIFSSRYSHNPTGYLETWWAIWWVRFYQLHWHWCIFFQLPWNSLHLLVILHRRICHSRRGDEHFISISNTQQSDYHLETIQDEHARLWI